MRIIIIIVGLSLALFLTGCSTTGTQAASAEPEYEWIHDDLYKEAESEAISWQEVDHRFVVDSNACKIQGLQVPIPSPSCSTIPAPDCSGEVGFMLGVCRAQTPHQRCDYSSVNAAYDAQRQIRDSCMRVNGWRKIPKGEGYQYSTSSLEKDEPDHWKANDPRAWQMYKLFRSDADTYMADLPEDERESLAIYSTRVRLNKSNSLVSYFFQDEHDDLMLQLINVDNLSKASVHDYLKARWTLIRNDPEFLVGDATFQRETMREFFTQRMGPFLKTDEEIQWGLETLERWHQETLYPRK